MRVPLGVACAALLLALSITSGCAATKQAAAPGDAFLPTAQSAELHAASRRVPVLEGQRAAAPAVDGSEVVDWSRLVADAATADAVLIGENHGHPLGLAAAASLWEDVLARSPGATLAMEFFERDEQLALSDFLSGVTDEATFVKAARRSAGNYPPGHREMILAAKNATRPVIAANAPRRYVRLARTEGYERLSALSALQREFFALPLASPQPPYRESFDTLMNGPSPGADAMFRSQQVWDWTMAQSVGVAMDSGKPVVLVVGRFHVDHNGGTLQALRQMRPNARVLSISCVDSEAAPGTSLRPEDVGRADYVIYVGAAPREPAR